MDRPLLRVLLVEDNPADAELVQAVLADSAGLELSWVGTLADAVAWVSHRPPEVVLLDLGLPDGFGLDTLKRFRALAPNVAVVVLTGIADQQLGTAALKEGAQDYLPKGATDPALLERAIRYAVERQHLVRRAQLLAREQAARLAAEEARKRAEFLAEVGTSLGVSIDWDATLATAARVPVPSFADACVVEVEVSDPEPCEIVAAHRDGALVTEVTMERARGHSSVLAERHAVLHERLRGDDPQAVLRHPERLGGMAASANAVIIAPIASHGRVLGAISFVRVRPRTFVESDLLVAEEIGRRAAAALENARLYREAREAVGVRDEFLSVAAHELRTPLAVLQLQLEMALERLARAGTPELEGLLEPHLQRATRQTRRLAGLVDTLLDVTRLTAGRVELRREPVDLAAIARSAAEQVAADAAHAGSTLSLDAATPVIGQWDRRAIERVLANLLSNAVKYGAGKPIDLAVGYAGDGATLMVRDRGIGIAAADVDRIFERFERAVSARHYGGLGLGLYIARQIVEAHGGRIDVTSRPSEGATFSVWLPLAPSEPLAEEAPA